MSETVYIGLGTNVGDREAQLARALAALGTIDAVAILGCSSLYDSAPVGPAQERFLNAGVELECGLSPQRLLVILKRIEQDLGRRASATRWGPRELDLDVLLWDGRVIADANLQVPHLELHRRRFALEPLCELHGGLLHPVLHLPLTELLRRTQRQDVVRVDASLWPSPTRDVVEQHG